MARLRALVGRERLVTLHGSAGTGKTRLAVEFGRAVAPSLGGRVWFVNLGALTTTEIIAETIASTLGLNATLDDPGDLIIDFLGEAPSLLILDNCEHVADEVAALAETMLDRAPSLRILATSREELRLRREHVLRLGGLDLAPGGEAMILFADRARRSAPSFHAAANREAVESICTLLDGLPLALELAAARLSSITPQQLLGYLGDPIALLTDPRRGSTDRASSLRSSIELTAELCDDAERHAWHRFAHLRSSFSVDDAAAMLEAPLADALTMIDALLAKSVIMRADEVAGHARFRMLYVLRAFGRDMLEPSDTSGPGIHAAWFAEQAAELEERWVGPRQDERLTALQESLPDLRASIQYGLDHDDADIVFRAAVWATAEVWWAGGRIDEGRFWVEKAVPVVTEPSRERVVTLVDAATLALAKGEFTAARAHLARAEQLLVDHPDVATPYARGDVAFGVAFEHLLHGRFAECVAEAERGLALNADAPPHPTPFRLRQLVVYAANGLGDASLGATVCHDLLSLSESVGETYYRAFALHNLALYAWRDGDLAQAQLHSSNGMQLSVHVPNRPENPDALLVAGFIAAERNDTERAATLFGAAVGTSRTRVASTALFAERQEDAERLLAWHTKIREVLHPAATVRGYRMTPAEAVSFALDATPRSSHENLLTSREREVVALVADGATNRQIAEALRITVRTAEGHVERIRRKLDVHSRVEIGTWFVRETLQHD